jgi:OPA family glycerol-3-phosphate transporter-like MFS transporter
MNVLTTKKDINKLILLFTLTYMVSYITRINYGAIIAEMEKTTKIARNLLSMAVTGSFITYGTGQIISGILGDKISPKRLVSLGFILTIVMNLLIPVCRNPYQMLIVWCINGFAQSFMWPPLVKLMTAYLSDDDYKKASVKISWGSSFGTIFVYLCAPPLISLGGWKTVFLFSAVAGIIMLFIWNKNALDFVPEKKPEITAVNKPKNKNLAVIFSPVMICIMIAIILQGMLRDGITSWMPTYLSEVFSLDNKLSILITVSLAIFSIISFSVAGLFYKRFFTNEVALSTVIFGVSAVSALILFAFFNSGVILTVFSMALITGCMHGINLMLISHVPKRFKKYGNISTMSGLINSCTYVGSAISTYVVALFSEIIGWRYTVGVWAIIAILGTLVCLLATKPWEKFFSK